MSGARSKIPTPGVRALVLLGGLGLAVGASACSYASQEDVDNELAQIRDEMRQGDRQNSDQIDQVGNRVDALEGRLASLEQELQSLEQDFNTTVERLESALRFSTPIYFAYDEAEVNTEGTSYLDRFSSVVGEYYPDATITVEGFTDPAGSAEYNQRLGQRRADAVRSYLTEDAGMSGDRIRAVSYGESGDRLIDPDASGPGQAGMANRRVVLVVDDIQGPASSRAPVTGPSEGS